MTDDLDGDGLEAADALEDDGDDRQEKPDLSTSPERYGSGDRHSGVIRFLVWLVSHGYSLVLGALAIGFAAALLAGYEVPRDGKIIVSTFVAGMVFLGYATGVKAVELLGGPDLVWLVDVDVLEDDGAGIFNIPRPRWSADWDVSKDSLWWATPNLAFGKFVDLEARTVEGTWRGSLPDPVLLRALWYIRYNRESYLDRAKRGEAIDVNKAGIIRNAIQDGIARIVETFDAGALPDDGESFHREVDAVLQEYGVGEDTDLFDPADEDARGGLDLESDDGPTAPANPVRNGGGTDD